MTRNSISRRGLRYALGALAGLLATVAGIAAAVAIHRPAHLVPLTWHVPVDIGTVPTAPAARPPRPVSAPLVPSRLRIPRLGVDSAVVPVVVDPAGALGVPRDPDVIGWWADGAKPGSPRGTAILDGHVNYAGAEGSLAHIDRLVPGDAVIVSGTAAGHPTSQHFTVTGTRTYSKHALPVASVFDQSSVGRLVLVTCGGAFDSGSGNYEDNILTYAVSDSSTAG